MPAAQRRRAPPSTLCSAGCLQGCGPAVCDRYSDPFQYKKLAAAWLRAEPLPVPKLVLAFCWHAHVSKRDFIKVAAARGDLPACEDWKDQWLSPDPAPVQAERAALAAITIPASRPAGGGI